MNTPQAHDSLLNEIETLQNELYKANYKHTQALDEIAILNSTIETLQSTIDNLCNRLLESKEQYNILECLHKDLLSETFEYRQF